MTLDEAIKRYTSNAEYERTHGSLQGCLEFRQLAEWLRDYKRLKEQQPCDDCISRQAAIGEVDSETVSTNPEHFKSSEKFIEFMDDADIASFGKWQWANGFNTALVAINLQLKKLPPVTPYKWIPVSERLPKENKTVIASTKYGVYPESKYTKEYGWEWAYEAGADYWKELEDVTAWMPVPTTYEPQESEAKE